MEILIGIAVGVLAVLAVPAFFVLKWFLEPLFGTRSGRSFH